MFNMPPVMDVALIMLVFLAGFVTLLLRLTPRINGGDHIEAMRLVKSFGFFILGGWYTYRLVEFGDVRISAIAALGIALIAFSTVVMGISRLAEVAPPKTPPKPVPNH